MDNNKQSLRSDDLNPVNPNPVPQPAGTTTTPNTNPTQPPQPPNIVQKSSKKMILILVSGLVIAVVLIGGAYFYVNNRGVKQSQLQTPPSPTPQTQDVLDTELNKVNVEDLETEFATVEADLQNL